MAFAQQLAGVFVHQAGQESLGNAVGRVRLERCACHQVRIPCREVLFGYRGISFRDKIVVQGSVSPASIPIQSSFAFGLDQVELGNTQHGYVEDPVIGCIFQAPAAAFRAGSASCGRTVQGTADIVGFKEAVCIRSGAEPVGTEQCVQGVGRQVVLAGVVQLPDVFGRRRGQRRKRSRDRV